MHTAATIDLRYRETNRFTFGIYALSSKLWIICLLVSLFYLPQIFSGISLDERAHHAIFSGWQLAPDPQGSYAQTLFTFFDGTQDRNKQLVETLGVPWWSHPELKISFFRPLTALDHFFDYKVLDSNPVAMHLKSVFWYLLLCIVVHSFFRLVIFPRNHYLPLLATV